MSKELKKECLAKLIERYGRRNREGKSRMLDELCDDFGYERKYAIKLLGAGRPSGPVRAHAGPERRYEGIEAVVRQIWLCAEHRVANGWCRSYGNGCRFTNCGTGL